MARSEEEKRKLYGRVIQSSYSAAMNEKLPLSLRQYYAGVALYYDRKLKG